MRTYEPLALLGFIIAGIIAGIIDRKNLETMRAESMLERELEAKFCRRLRQAGAMPLKFVSPGKMGVPDRIVLAPGGRVFFVELKRPGGKARPIQRRVMEEMGSLGFMVHVIDSLQGVEAFAREVEAP